MVDLFCLLIEESISFDSVLIPYNDALPVRSFVRLMNIFLSTLLFFLFLFFFLFGRSATAAEAGKRRSEEHDAQLKAGAIVAAEFLSVGNGEDGVRSRFPAQANLV